MLAQYARISRVRDRGNRQGKIELIRIFVTIRTIRKLYQDCKQFVLAGDCWNFAGLCAEVAQTTTVDVRFPFPFLNVANEKAA